MIKDFHVTQNVHHAFAVTWVNQSDSHFMEHLLWFVFLDQVGIFQNKDSQYL